MGRKRFMGVFLSFLMALSLVPFTGIAVFAEEEGPQIWFEYQDGTNEFWADAGAKEVTVHLSGLDPAHEYGVEINAGVRGDAGWDVFLDPETDFQKTKTEDGYQLTFEYETILDAYQQHDVQADWINLFGAIYEKPDFNWETDEPLAMGFGDLSLRKAREEYNMERDREMVFGWGGDVQNRMHVRVENSSYPEGYEQEVPVTGVEFVPQEGQTVRASEDNPEELYLIEEASGKELLRLRKDYEEGDSSSEKYWWHYDAMEEYVSVPLKVSYQKLDGTATDYIFYVNVQSDVYEAEIVYDGPTSNCLLPGMTVPVRAAVRHYTAEGEASISGLTCEWDIVDGDREAASLITSGSSAQAQIKGGALDPEDDSQHWFNVCVIVRNGQDIVTSAELWTFVANQFYIPSPAELDLDLDVGKSQTVSLELHRYQTGQKSYEVVKDVHVRCYYDSKCVEVTDANGQTIGNEDDKGEYRDSDASYTGNAFTFTRLGDWYTNLDMHFEFTDENGEFRDENYPYYFRNKNLDFYFADGYAEVYDDQTLQLPLFCDAIGGALQLELEAGVWDGEEPVYDASQEGIATVQQMEDFYLVFVDGVKLKNFIQGKETGGVELRAYLKYGDRILRDARCWVESRDSCQSHLWSGWTVINEPTESAMGYKVRICMNCGERETELLPKLALSVPKTAYTKTFGDAAFTLGAKEAYGRTLKYQSSKTGVAAVDAKGKVTIKGAGKAVLTVSLADYPDVKQEVTVTVKKAVNPLKVSGKKVTVKASVVKKKAQTIAAKKAIAVSKNQGKVTYQKKSGNAKITVNAKTGAIQVKKGLKKGTYKVQINVTAAGNGNYNKGTKRATVQIIVK